MKTIGFLQAEAAEIAKVFEFNNIDSVQAQAVEAWDRSHAGESSGGMLRDCSNPFVVDEAIRILRLCRSSLEKSGFSKDADPWLFKKLYGLNHDGTVPLGIFRTFQACTEFATQAPDENNRHSPDELTKVMIETFDAEIRRLEAVKALALEIHERRRPYQKIAALIPSQPVLERLLRYESHLSREFDRTLNQLERLQRIRQGQPVPPSLRVELSG